MKKYVNQEITLDLNQNLWFETDLESCMNSYLDSCIARNLAPGTLRFYRQKLSNFFNFCESQIISEITQINTQILYRYLNWLKETGHNEGGTAAHYRAIKSFLRWWENENEPERWKNPINKIKTPKVSLPPLEPVSETSLIKLLRTCDSSYVGLRDETIFLMLYDCGLRANELLSIEIKDLNLQRGTIQIRKGKGGKSRIVVMGSVLKKSIRKWLRIRKGNRGKLFTTKTNKALKLGLTYDGLRSMVIRRANIAGINPPTLHSFRRAFCINWLRNDGDLFTLQRFTGHSDIQVLRRYLALIDDDLIRAHRRFSPVDRMVSC